MLPSNSIQQPDHIMNIISSLNFVQLHRFIGSNGGSEEEFAGDTEKVKKVRLSHHRYSLEQPEN